jgi:DNA-binding NtrC family response regulator
MPKSDFAILVYDPSSPSGAMKVMLEGPWMQTWGDETCREVVGLLDQAPAKFVLTDLTLAGGVSVEVPALIEQARPRVVVTGARADTSPYVNTTEDGPFDFTIPPFEVENIVRILKDSVNSFSNRKEAQEIKAVA